MVSVNLLSATAFSIKRAVRDFRICSYKVEETRRDHLRHLEDVNGLAHKDGILFEAIEKEMAFVFIFPTSVRRDIVGIEIAHNSTNIKPCLFDTSLKVNEFLND